MRPDRLGFRPAQTRLFIHRIRYKREREYIICYSTNETETVREAKRMSETGNHLIHDVKSRRKRQAVYEDGRVSVCSGQQMETVEGYPG